MLLRSLHHQRQGAVIIESAIVYPIFFMLTLGMVVMSMGIFRYQEVSFVAHEAARYAAVRGADRRDDTALASPTEAELRTYITNFNFQATADPNNLTTTVTHTTANATTSWDSSTKAVYSYVGTTSTLKRNHVSVTVTYNWTPEFWPFPGNTPVIPLTSTSTVDMQY